ncbi:MAG: TonB-dependent receptor [Novosphingobium sp.]
MPVFTAPLRRHAMLTSALGLVALPGLAWGQDQEAPSGGLNEIVVTAQHRAENLQEVPIAISAVTAESLEQTGISSTNAITQLVPAVQFTRSGPSGLFFVRGVGTTNAAAGEEGSNAFYIDGVYMPDLGQTINNFNNVERIEVLKGPQGTLFGRNAFGGLVHVITRDPGDELVIKGQIGYANYQTVSGQFYAGGPVTDKLGWDIAFTGQDQGKGWGHNLTLDRNVKKDDHWGVRSKAVFKPQEGLKFTLAGDYYEIKDNTALVWKITPDFLGTGGFAGPKGHDTTANDPSLTRLKIRGVSLKTEADLDFATLTSVTAFRKNDNHSYFDTDAGPLPLIDIEYRSGSKSFQQELRLASNQTEPLSWQVGVFYLNAKADNDSQFRGMAFGAGGLAGQDIQASLKTHSYAAFGEATYAITPTTHLTGGLRYTRDERKFDGSITNILLNGTPLPTTAYPRATDPWSDKISYNKLTWRVALRQDLSDDVNVYVSANRGFKAGAYSLQAPSNAPVYPMFITAYEAGIKSELFDRRLRLNVAAFHYDISDYQIRSAATSNAGSSVLLNAADVKVDGLDVEFEAVPTDFLRIFGGFAILDARYSDFAPHPDRGLAGAPFVYPRPAVCDAPGTGDPGSITGPATGGLLTCFGDATGNRTPLAPKFAGTIGATVTVPVGAEQELRVSANYAYNSGYVFEPDEVLRQGSFGLFNASAEFRVNENWSLAVWGRNLGNTRWYAQKSATGTGPFATLAAPWTYGLDVKLNY